MKQNGDYVIDREVNNMDYIPSNRHGDYIAHSEEYLMHYGVKGMKWKDHDYVEDVKTGAREVVGDVKSKIKQLKKFVSKKLGKKTEKPKYEYKEETDDERKARKWKTWAKIKADKSRDAAIKSSTQKGMQAVANQKVENRNARIKENSVKSLAANDSKTVSLQQKSRENAQSYGQNRAYNHIQTEKYYKTAAAKEADRKRTRDAGYDTANSMKVTAENKNRRINSPSGYVNSGTNTRDADIRKGTQNSMNATRDSRTETKVQVTNNINRLASEASPKRPGPNPTSFESYDVEVKRRNDMSDLKDYLKVKKNKKNR